MKRLATLSVLTALLVLTLVGSATAEIPLVFHTFRQDYCPRDQELPTPHNEGVTIVQVVPNDDFLELPKIGLGIVYESDSIPQGQLGRIVAKVELQRAAGGSRSLGKVKARQGPDGTALKFKFKKVKLGEGDRIVWGIEFRDFAPLSDCFLLEGGLVDPDGL